MDNYKTSKLQKFLEDKAMSNAVYEAIRDVFLKDKKYGNDINTLAAKMLAIILLEKAWEELERFKSKEDEGGAKLTQVGM